MCKKLKEYTFEVNVSWLQAGIEAKTDEEAIDKLQETFYQEFGFAPEEKEIKILEKNE